VTDAQETAVHWKGIPLGPYVLDRVVGSGGMGEVWAASHRPSGAKVAIKVMGGLGALNRHFLAAFRNEIRATAGMEHPSIVRVFDRGEVPQETSLATGGRIQADSPYLVMEYVGGGALKRLCGAISWWEIRQVLLRLLDALAHAHARGIVHRDIKPENVLLTKDRGEVKLTDFGLAHAVERVSPGERERGLVGTPRYMPPEQCRGEWRDYGPWTDFYALGCLGYALAAGHPPFAHITSHWDLVRAQSTLPPPPLDPRSPVPPGYEEWLLRLMAKDPADRYQRASEAASDLGHLAQSTSDATVSFFALDEDDVATDPAISSEMTILLSRAEPGQLTTLVDADDRLETIEDLPDEGMTLETVRTIPASWRPPERPGRAPLPLVGAGLAVYWLRAIPVVGRARERDALWNNLGMAVESRRARVVLLRGPPGVGKSRLASWIGERAHEIAGCSAMTVHYGPDGAGRDGLAAALTRQYRLGGLDRDKVLARLTTRLAREGVTDPDEVQALTELVRPATEEDGRADGRGPGGVRFANRVERTNLLRRTLARLARARPLVLVLDGVHHSTEGIEFARLLLASQDRDPCPMLVVMTARSDELADRPSERDLLVDLLTREGTDRLDLGPLDARDTQQLVRRLLHLEGDLAMQVEERTLGNPAFAMQLVGSWVDRGLLEPGQRGFRLRRGAKAEIPDGLHTVWTARIERFLDGRSVHDGPALELAAALGQRVDSEEWWEACSLAAITPSLDLVDALLDECLAVCGAVGPEEGWSFAHAMLRESLERRAAEGERLREHHLVCARLLERRPDPGTTERLGRHLIGASRLAEALLPLLDGARDRLATDEIRRAEALLGEYERALHELRVPWDDVRWGHAWLLRVRAATLRGDEDGFIEWADRTGEYASAHGWEDVALELTLERARRARRAGELHEAESMLSGLEADAGERGNDRLLAGCIFEQARLAEDAGRRVGAAELYRRATGLYQARHDGVAAGRGLVSLARILARQGDLEASQEYLELAGDLFARWGSLAGRASCSELMGLTARLQGEPEAAITCYREAVARYEALGSSEIWSARAGLGQLLAWEGRIEEATVLLMECLDHFSRRSAAPTMAALHTALLPCLARTRRWGPFDEHLDAARALLGQTRVADEDAGWSARLAGDAALEVGEKGRAQQAWGLAVEVYVAAGLGGAAAMVRRKLASV
jgi:eukaryotic-like serine/threonine-protein kinase